MNWFKRQCHVHPKAGSRPPGLTFAKRETTPICAKSSTAFKASLALARVSSKWGTRTGIGIVVRHTSVLSDCVEPFPSGARLETILVEVECVANLVLKYRGCTDTSSEYNYSASHICRVRSWNGDYMLNPLSLVNRDSPKKVNHACLTATGQ